MAAILASSDDDSRSLDSAGIRERIVLRLGMTGSGDCPDAGEAADAGGGNAEVGAGADQDFFQAAHVLDRAQGLALAVGRGDAAQIENGIADELAGTVERDVAAAIAFEYFHAALGQQFGRSDDVFLLGIAAESDDRRVFEQKKNVADAAFLAQFDQALLQAQAGGVIDGAELEDGDQEILCHGFSRINTDQKMTKI